MGSFEQDFGWQRRFMPEIKRILGEHLICEAPPEEDRLHNTDLIVLKLDAVRVACRMRRNKYLAKYGGQFTIRAHRRHDVETELQKVLRGWGDFIFYGFADPGETHLVQWVLGDLDVFRLWHHQQLTLLPPERVPGEPVPNGDGSSIGRAYCVRDLPREFVKAWGRSPGIAA